MRKDRAGVSLVLAVIVLWKNAAQELHKRGAGTCPRGWFGENCAYLCHCSSGVQCNQTTGECPPNVPCEVEFFGPGCQYVDLLIPYGHHKNPEYLSDRDPRSCNPYPGATTVTVNFQRRVFFTWFRLHTDHDMSHHDLVVYLDMVNCAGRRMYRVSASVLDVSCDLDSLTQTLHLKGPTVGHICEMEISGGRNVAIKHRSLQSSSATHVNRSMTQASNAVDGSRDPHLLNGSCSQTGSVIGNPTWMLEFSRPQKLSRIFVFNSDEHADRLVGFHLELYDGSSSDPVYRFLELTGRAQPVYEIQVPAAYAAINLLKIWRHENIQNTSENMMALCEVEAYGETMCPEGNYGLYCQGTCDCGTYQRCSRVTGACGTPCVTDQFGLHCSYPCHPHCLNQLCHEEGECISCNAGYLGDFCEEECPSGQYGFNCSQLCPENCRGSTCHATSGHCHACSQTTQVLPFCQWQNKTELKILHLKTAEHTCPIGKFGANCNRSCHYNCVGRICNATDGSCQICTANQTGCLVAALGGTPRPLHYSTWQMVLPFLLPMGFLIVFILHQHNKRHSRPEDAEMDSGQPSKSTRVSDV